LGIGPGAQMQQPLAIMVIGGLTANMLFTRMIIPVGYLVLERSRRKTEAAPLPLTSAPSSAMRATEPQVLSSSPLSALEATPPNGSPVTEAPSKLSPDSPSQPVSQ
jgi:hypothetical protein